MKILTIQCVTHCLSDSKIFQQQASWAYRMVSVLKLFGEFSSHHAYVIHKFGRYSHLSAEKVLSPWECCMLTFPKYSDVKHKSSIQSSDAYLIIQVYGISQLKTIPDTSMHSLYMAPKDNYLSCGAQTVSFIATFHTLLAHLKDGAY